MRKCTLFVCIVLLALFSFSCQHDEIYYHFKELRNAEWATNDTLVFNIDSTAFEVNRPYDISLEVTSNITYPYRNIWFFIQHDIANDSVYTDLSREYFLSDELGRSYGAGFGSLHQISFPFDKGIIFKEKRNYQIKIEHGMRDNLLIGIEKVGIRITKQYQ